MQGVEALIMLLDVLPDFKVYLNDSASDNETRRATENRFFAGSDQFLVCKTNSICIKRISFGPKKTHFVDHITWISQVSNR